MDYKATLNLPQTSFPMKANLPQREQVSAFYLDVLKDRLYTLAAQAPERRAAL